MRRAGALVDPCATESPHNGRTSTSGSAAILDDISSLTASDLEPARNYIRAAHWIVCVLDPRRPSLPEVSRWATSIRAAADVEDARARTRLVRPRSLVAHGLAERLALVMAPAEEAERTAAQACVVPGAPLRECILALADRAGVLPPHAYPATLLIAVGANLSRGGGRSAGYQRLRHTLDTLVIEPDGAWTERSLREARLKHLLAIPQAQQRDEDRSAA